tara:strand:- start:1185 stop:1961 length:777 start_codon:yes stop_codon:yes gene_type:complete
MPIQEKLPLSVLLVSFNEEDNIARTLSSIKDIASEIIVVDSNSTDKTRDIAKSYGARVFEEDWKGHIAQKNSALEKCTQEWLLSLDCDEVVSVELKKSIIEKVRKPEADGYFINRKTYYMGRFLNHAWQPDWKLRVAKKAAKPEWDGYNPHDILKINGPIKNLRGDLYHYSYKNLEDHFCRTVKYAKFSAQSYFKKEKKFRWHKLLLNPISAFAKVYFIQRGFLDGYRGFIIAASSFTYTFLKYIFLWEIEKNNEQHL